MNTKNNYPQSDKFIDDFLIERGHEKDIEPDKREKISKIRKLETRKQMQINMLVIENSDKKN